MRGDNFICFNLKLTKLTLKSVVNPREINKNKVNHSNKYLDI